MRVWALFGAQNATAPYTGRPTAKQRAFYDHGYKQPGEHYHISFEELEDCPLLRPDGWRPPARKVFR